MPAALRSLDADVICLQEVWVPGARESLARALSAEYAIARSTAGGLMVLSRLPILGERYRKFPEIEGESLVEALAGKGLLEVEIGTDLGPVRVVDSHLASGDAVARDRQLRFLLSHVERDLPLVVAADTNFWKVWQGARTAPYESVLAAGLRDADPPRVGKDGTLDAGEPTRPGWPRGSRDSWGPTYPDHVFYRGTAGVGVRVVGFRQALDTADAALSDHNALVADFRLGDARAPGR